MVAELLHPHLGKVSRDGLHVCKAAAVMAQTTCCEFVNMDIGNTERGPVRREFWGWWVKDAVRIGARLGYTTAGQYSILGAQVGGFPSVRQDTNIWKTFSIAIMRITMVVNRPALHRGLGFCSSERGGAAPSQPYTLAPRFCILRIPLPQRRVVVYIGVHVIVP